MRSPLISGQVGSLCALFSGSGCIRDEHRSTRPDMYANRAASVCRVDPVVITAVATRASCEGLRLVAFMPEFVTVVLVLPTVGVAGSGCVEQGAVCVEADELANCATK